MASVPRILAVDDREDIGRILRSAMSLMDRRSILVEVPTAEDALNELQSSSQVDLLVTVYQLPDSNGLDLAARAIRESAGTPIIVLANSDDPEVDPEAIENAPYSFLVRPVGEQFLRELRIGLDGEAAVTAQEGNGTSLSGQELGPVPSINETELRDQVMQMMRDTVAMGAFVADRMGRLVFAEGITGYFDINVVAANLAPQFTRTAELREQIGGNAWGLQYFDGDDYDLFAMSLGLHYFVVLIFDGSKRAQFGPVTNFGRKGADAIAELLGDEAWAFRRKIARTTQSMRAVKISQEEQTETDEDEDESDDADSEEEAPELTPAETPELTLEPLKDFDPEALFSEDVDENAFDDLFSEDELSQENTFISADNSVSFEEAMEKGFLDE